jgi:hypothetical protein
MVITTTIEQEKQRNELWTAVMEQLQKRIAKTISINPKGLTFQKEIDRANPTPKERLKRKTRPYFTTDIPIQCLRYRRVWKKGDPLSPFCDPDPKHFRDTDGISQENYLVNYPNARFNYDEVYGIGSRKSRIWVFRCFDLRNVKWGKSATGTTNLKDSQEHGIKYNIKDLKEMCKMNAIKVPSAAKYQDIVALLKTLP